ncbi:MAG: sigma-54-dependent transcriptional regulator, partial [Pseudomonadaceae bacterium]
MSPRLLIIDDLFGRNIATNRNFDRENLCAHFLWQDTTDDDATNASQQEVLKPNADVVFYRGQTPISANVSAVVENDLAGSLAIVREGWTTALKKGKSPWAMLLLDLCFYTGRVTEESNRRTPGMPEGRPGDDDPQGYFGLTLLDAIHQEFPELPIFILSSKPREEVSLEFSKRGALGFIDRSDLRGPELLQEAIWHHGLLPDPTGEIVGNSLQLLLALRKARQAAKLRENILIRGELGTGKELMAKYVHRVSTPTKSLKPKDLVTMDASGLTPEMFSAEMFGIKPKTATGVDGNVGWIETAEGGDLFLDEVANMRMDVQAGLLRVLQDRKITPVGSRKSKSVDVRFISATNAFLENETKFKPDLLDRLRLGGTIWLPALRERK